MANFEENNFDLETKINGKSINDFFAEMLEKNDKLEIEIERGKLAVSIAKQMNNNSRLQLDAEKYKLKKLEFNMKQGQITQNV